MSRTTSVLGSRSVHLLWLLGVWLALWGSVSFANVVSGLVTGVFALWLVVPGRYERPGTVRPLALAKFVVFTAWSVVKATSVVAWEVVTPTNQVNQAVVAVPVATRVPGVLTVVSHAIGLAPGTMVIDITEHDDEEYPTMLHVHVLHLQSVEACRAEVHHLMALAFDAFPDARWQLGDSQAELDA